MAALPRRQVPGQILYVCYPCYPGSTVTSDGPIRVLFDRHMASKYTTYARTKHVPRR